MTTCEFILLRTCDHDIKHIENILVEIQNMKGLYYTEETHVLKIKIQNLYTNFQQESYLNRIAKLDNGLINIKSKINEFLNNLDDAPCANCSFCQDIVSFDFEFGPDQQNLTDKDRFRLICKKKIKIFEDLLQSIIVLKKKYTLLNIRKALSNLITVEDNDIMWDKIKNFSIIPTMSFNLTQLSKELNIDILFKDIYNKEMFKITEYVDYSKIMTCDNFLDSYYSVDKNESSIYKIICREYNTQDNTHVSYRQYPI